MFKKIGRLAEGLATNVSASRRGFLGRVGRSALGVAGALGALGVAASAGSGGVVCCRYNCFPYNRGDYSVCLPGGSTCPSTVVGPGDGLPCNLVKTQTKSNCSKC
jgi:hypothetical protein